MNKEIVGKNLLDKEPILTGKGLPKIIGITENQYYEYKQLQQENKQLKDNWNELKKWLEEEKNRLSRECSQIYEDSLGKTRLVNEDIYNEVENISNKMQELEGSDSNE